MTVVRVGVVGVAAAWEGVEGLCVKREAGREGGGRTSGINVSGLHVVDGGGEVGGGRVRVVGSVEVTNDLGRGGEGVGGCERISGKSLFQPIKDPIWNLQSSTSPKPVR